MNAEDNLREFKQYYPDIPMSRELIFHCGCRHWREDITSHPLICPDHCARVKYHLTTCPDCGRVVIRKRHSRHHTCGQCSKVRRMVYLELHRDGCFDSDDVVTFRDIGRQVGLTREHTEVIYKQAMKKLRKRITSKCNSTNNSELRELREVFNELSDSETLSSYGVIHNPNRED